jgi:hypothetical protein
MIALLAALLGLNNKEVEQQPLKTYFDGIQQGRELGYKEGYLAGLNEAIAKLKKI